MNAEIPGQIPLVEVEPTPVPAPKIRRGSGTPVYAKYRPKKPVKCDDCVLLLVQMEGFAPLARFARFSRSAGGVRRLLCAAHVRQWRERDKLPKKKEWR